MTRLARSVDKYVRRAVRDIRSGSSTLARELKTLDRFNAIPADLRDFIARQIRLGAEKTPRA